MGGGDLYTEASVSQFWPYGDENKNVNTYFLVTFCFVYFYLFSRQPKIV